MQDITTEVETKAETETEIETKTETETEIETKTESKQTGVTLGTLSISIISMSIILILALIKIYLSNKIYYESRYVNLIEAEVEALKEENNILQLNVEQLKYKSKVTDTIFSMDEMPQMTQQASQQTTTNQNNNKGIDPRKEGSYDD